MGDSKKSYQSKMIQWCRRRWSVKMVNDIVMALNEGEPIRSFLERIQKCKEFPARPGKLDLRGIDFSHQNLRGPWKEKSSKRFRMGVDLKNADLSFGYLNWTILPRADLRQSILIETEMENAELIFTNLSKADLTGANLKGAWLWDTNLVGAKVTEKQLESRRNLGQMDFDYRAYEL